MNLYICLTPLQILIANKLIELKNEQVDVLILSYTLNNKYDYYIHKIKQNKNVNHVSVIKINNATIANRIATFKAVISWCHDKNFKNIYLASLDNFYMHYILSRCLQGDVYTFDDGTMNIAENSNYFVARPSLISRMARFLFYIDWDLIKIKEQTQKHYTIYHNMKNVVRNTENIHVFASDYQDNCPKDNIVPIFLGQPFRDKMDSIHIYKKLAEKYVGLKYYIHPREDLDFVTQMIESANMIQSDLIVEDYISELLKKNLQVHLLTVSSSAGFNLYCTKGVFVEFVMIVKLDDEVGNIYKIVQEQSMNTIEMIL